MASLSFTITSSLPGAWPVTESSSPMDLVATRSKRAPYLTRPSPKRKQTTLERPMLNGTTTWKLSSDPIPPGSKRRPYSASPPSQKVKQIRDQVLKQTTIKQYARDGHPSLSLEDVNELCKALARLSLSELRSSYNQFRTPIYKWNKVYRQRPSTFSPFCRGHAFLLAPESSGPPPMSIFPSTPNGPATPIRPSPILTPSPPQARQEAPREHADRANNFRRIPSPFPSPPSVESSPCPPGRRHSERRAPTNEPVNNHMTQMDGISSRGIERIRASPDSEFTRHKPKRIPSTIDDRIAKRLLEGTKATSSVGSTDRSGNYGSSASEGRTLQDRPKGFNYVISRPTSDGFVKIGATTDIDRRLNEISRGGFFGNLILHDHCRQREFRHFKLAETIVMNELHNIRYDSDYKPTLPLREGRSPPGKESGLTEWYRTSPEHANEVVSKWRDWFDCEPYDANGKLVAFWRKRIKSREKYDEARHGNMHARWTELLKQPTKSQLRRFQFVHALEAAGSTMSNAFKFFQYAKGIYFVVVVGIYYHLVGSLSFGATSLVFGLFLVSGLAK